MVSMQFVLLVSACMDFGFDPIDEEPPVERVVVVDQHAQAALPAVDLLFVVDDTGSMAQEQSSLGRHFASLADSLAQAGVAWQAGVVTTDLSASDAGWLRGTPWVLTPDLPGVESLFAETVAVGTEGASPEAGLAAASLALDLSGPDGINAGFRRPDAVLHVVFVSDSDDQSDAWLDDPVEDFLDILAAEEAWTGLPARASAVVGDLPGGCTSINGSARPGERYHQVARATDGVVASICAVDFSGILASIADQAIVWQTRFPLRAEPLDDTVRVSVDGARQWDGWSLELDPAAVVFDAPPSPGALIEIQYTIGGEG